MFEEIPSKKPYSSGPTGYEQVRDYQHMLTLFNYALTTAPAWNDNSYSIGMLERASTRFSTGRWGPQAALLSSSIRMSTPC